MSTFYLPQHIQSTHMSHRIFTHSQQEELQKNLHVRSCSAQSISYHQKFKKEVLHAYQNEYRNAREIFETAGFNLDIIGKDIPHQCISRWKRDGIEGKRGRTKKLVFPSLEAELAYVKAENIHLKQLRAKRAEQYSSRKKNTL